MDLNKVMIIGRLTRDPEVKTIASGQTVASFSIATNRTWTDRQSSEKKSQTEYHNVVAWRKLADIIGQYLQKGSQVYIEGYLQTRSWDDQAGQKRYRTEIVADNMIMLGGKGNSAGGGVPAQAQSQAAAAPMATAPTMSDAIPSAPQPQPTEDTISVEDIPF